MWCVRSSHGVICFPTIANFGAKAGDFVHVASEGRKSWSLIQANDILVKTFSAIELEILTALNSDQVIPELPLVVSLNPLLPTQKQPSFPSLTLLWLDKQPEKSVLYVSFRNLLMMLRE